jgi:hypothetical protein
MSTEKTRGTIKTQRWNIQKINGSQKCGQIMLELAGDGSHRESTGYKTHRPGAPSVPAHIGSEQILSTNNKAKRADFIKVLPF